MIDIRTPAPFHAALALSRPGFSALRQRVSTYQLLAADTYGLLARGNGRLLAVMGFIPVAHDGDGRHVDECFLILPADAPALAARHGAALVRAARLTLAARWHDGMAGAYVLVRQSAGSGVLRPGVRLARLAGFAKQSAGPLEFDRFDYEGPHVTDSAIHRFPVRYGVGQGKAAGATARTGAGAAGHPVAEPATGGA